jgi:hypothetical protein
MRPFLYTCLLLFVCCGTATAQDIDRNAFSETQKLVGKLGPMQDSSLKSIVNSITSRCNSEACIAYAIYLWTAQHIARDCRHPEKQNNAASYVLRTREAGSEGFANLIAEMCKLVHIPCEVVDGLVKVDAEDIGHVDKDANLGFWNMITVSGKRYALDASLGAGECSGRHFQKEMTDGWFMTNRRLFSISHFTTDKNFQLLDEPIDRSEFIAAPIVKAVANIIALVPPPGTRGILRGRAEDTIRLSFNVMPAANVERIGSAAIVVDGGKPIPIPFAKGASVLTVAIPFPEEGRYPLRLLINNYPAFDFQVQASAAPKNKTIRH